MDGVTFRALKSRPKHPVFVFRSHGQIWGGVSLVIYSGVMLYIFRENLAFALLLLVLPAVFGAISGHVILNHRSFRTTEVCEERILFKGISGESVEIGKEEILMIELYLSESTFSFGTVTIVCDGISYSIPLKESGLQEYGMVVFLHTLYQLNDQMYLRLCSEKQWALLNWFFLDVEDKEGSRLVPRRKGGSA